MPPGHQKEGREIKQPVSLDVRHTVGWQLRVEEQSLAMSEKLKLGEKALAAFIIYRGGT